MNTDLQLWGEVRVDVLSAWGALGARPGLHALPKGPHLGCGQCCLLVLGKHKRLSLQMQH